MRASSKLADDATVFSLLRMELTSQEQLCIKENWGLRPVK